MSGMRLDFAAAHEAATRLGAAQAAIAQRISALESAAATLSGGWSGEAQAAYASAQAQWSGSMTEMNALLDGARQALDEWVGDVERLEAELASGWPG